MVLWYYEKVWVFCEISAIGIIFTQKRALKRNKAPPQIPPPTYKVYLAQKILTLPFLPKQEQEKIKSYWILWWISMYLLLLEPCHFDLVCVALWKTFATWGTWKKLVRCAVLTNWQDAHSYNSPGILDKKRAWRLQKNNTFLVTLFWKLCHSFWKLHF